MSRNKALRMSNSCRFMNTPLMIHGGYQGVGYFAATSRYGSPKDLMYFIDEMHQAGIGVILDWVLGHICKDAHGLSYFDGSPLYEFDDQHRREKCCLGDKQFRFFKRHYEVLYAFCTFILGQNVPY